MFFKNNKSPSVTLSHSNRSILSSQLDDREAPRLIMIGLQSSSIFKQKTLFCAIVKALLIGKLASLIGPLSALIAPLPIKQRFFVCSFATVRPSLISPPISPFFLSISFLFFVLTIVFKLLFFCDFWPFS